jgi:hypothetical protein
MPIYNFQNKKTKKKFTEMMSISERDEYLEKNPNIVQLPPDQLNVGDSIKLGITKPPSDFSKYVLGKIKARHPKGNVERKFGSIAREI